MSSPNVKNLAHIDQFLSREVEGIIAGVKTEANNIQWRPPDATTDVSG
jgi:hypothetical protein